MIVNFYHLAQAPLERVLPSICQSLVGAGERVLVVAGEGELARLDEQLWTYAPDSFLPHGRDRAETQPVLLSAYAEPRNGARCIALADGLWREEALGFERIYYFFDGGGRDAARALWRTLKGSPEMEPRYWKQDERGKWVEGP